MQLPMDSPKSPKDTLRPEILEFTPYSPGLSIDEIKERFKLPGVIKLASNENPLGASPLVQRVLARRAETAFRYPQSGNPRLVAAIAAHHGVPASCVVPGNGSDEIIDLLLRVKARPGVDNVVAFDPCFSIYRLQAKLCGVELRQTRLGKDFSFPFQALLDLCDDNTALVFVTNPDNPSGHAVRAAELAYLAKALPPRALLVVDEAYVEFALPEDEYSVMGRLESLPNVVVLRTFSKLYGLAGLRLGFGVMPQWLADLMMRVRLPFSVNLLAEAAGIAALEDLHFRQATLETVRAGRDWLTGELTRLGCAVAPSQANFLLFTPPAPAKAVFEALLSKGIIIRPLASYGLPDALRVSIGSEPENKAFIKAFEAVLSSGLPDVQGARGE
ncbi:MAG: histidinol-phosphate transaminase [Acidobacteriota bacterium]